MLEVVEEGEEGVQPVDVMQAFSQLVAAVDELPQLVIVDFAGPACAPSQLTLPQKA